MPAGCLLDTGPIVAALDRSEKAHAACVAAINEQRGPIVTTEAVLTEATHLLADQPDGLATCVEFVLGLGAIFVPLDLAMFRRAAALMRKYANLPMDFADATLVLLAEELRITKVLTLDRRGFNAYRTAAGKRFSIVPERWSA